MRRALDQLERLEVTLFSRRPRSIEEPGDIENLCFSPRSNRFFAAQLYVLPLYRDIEDS